MLELYLPQVRMLGGWGQSDSTRDWLHEDGALQVYQTPEAADAAARAELDDYCAMLGEDEEGTYTWGQNDDHDPYANGFWFVVRLDGSQIDEGRVAIRKVLVAPKQED